MARTRYAMARLTEQEHEALSRLSHAAGITMADWIRRAIVLAEHDERQQPAPTPLLKVA